MINKTFLRLALAFVFLMASVVTFYFLSEFPDNRIPKDKLVQAYLGDAKIQYELSLLYSDLGDIEKYQKWMKKSANQQYSPALHHYTGELDNPTEAKRMIEKAAHKGDFYAQMKMANSAHSTEEARAWAVKAASSGEYAKQVQAADIFARTNPPDYVEAYYWRSIAAVSYAALGEGSLDSVLLSYKNHLTPEQIETVDKRVKLYKPNVCIHPEDGGKYTCFVCSDENGQPPC